MNLKSVRAAVLFIALATPLVFGFQNCSKQNLSSLNTDLSATSTADLCVINPSAAGCVKPTKSKCIFNGSIYSEGQTVTAYLLSNGAKCVSEVRVCRGGSFTGSYNYGSCKQNELASCLFNGQTLVSGQMVKAYQTSAVAFGQSCVSQDRFCTNGNLSGSYIFESCSAGGAASCVFNGQNIASGQTVKSYLASSVAFGQSCTPQDRVCSNGNLSGNYNYGTCSAGIAASCLLDGRTLAHNESVQAFNSRSVSYSQSCQSSLRLCNNGSLDGNNSFQFLMCSPSSGSSCNFNGQTIANGSAVTGFLTATVPADQSCQAQNRVCVNGVLSGTYAAVSCSANSLSAAPMKNLYFGYFGDGMNGNGTGNYLNETAARSNIHFIREEPTNYQAWKLKLNTARANNNQVILMVQHVLYPWEGIVPHADAAQRFAAFYTQIKSYKDIIAGYYLYDEPYWNNQLQGSKKTMTEVYSGLQTASLAIKNQHPEGKVILTFAYPEIALNPKIPTAVDWIGLNCYYAYGDYCTEPKIESMVKYLQENMSVEQKMILTLDAYMSSVATSDVQYKMIARIKFWLNITKNLPIAAYVPFLFQDQPSENLYGAKSHPIVLSFLDKLFNIIMANPSLSHASIANMAQEISNVGAAQVKCVIQDPICEGSDSVRRDSCGKELERWKSAPICSTVKCEGLDYVRRDSSGQIVEVWKNASICPQ